GRPLRFQHLSQHRQRIRGTRPSGVERQMRDGFRQLFPAQPVLLRKTQMERQLLGRAARDLLALQSPTASRFRSDGALEAVAAKSLRPGDILRLAPGDRAPVDVEIVSGSSDVDLSLVTGESRPQRRNAGLLHAGVLNLSTPLIVRALKTTEDSLLAELARLIEAGEQSKSRYRRLADQAAALYVPVVHALAASTFLVWFFVMHAGVRVSLMNAIAVLIITCPCALALAAPAVQVVATGRLFRRGVLVKSGDALERLALVDTIAFDKTGTLTFGRQRVANLQSIPEGMLDAAAALARASRHPLSRAIAAAAGPGPVAAEIVETPGEGVEGRIDGAPARLGRASFVGVASTAGKETSAWFRLGDREPFRFAFDDEIRPDAADAIRQLKARGLDVVMLSGDEASPARAAADALDVAFKAALKPQQKIDAIEALARSGRKVAMVGDGLNDAPSLAAALASLSPSAATDAAQSAADFVYQGESVAPVVEAIDVARAARRRMIENFAFAALYNFFAVPLAALGFVTPLIAALAMSGSSLVVTLNALRLSGGGGAR
ncbi:MAG: cadmium-translocating P-type ATPase, partial [Parvularculaceae bacterium]|nr:cadmium-translocating P-type ATPase [Parvularculaceae bacterium]